MNCELTSHLFNWRPTQYLCQVMMYTRASASDYDDWERLYANPGWGSKDLLPLLEKVCRLSRNEAAFPLTSTAVQVETFQTKPGAETHGTSGPLNVSRGGIYSNVGKQFLDVAKHMDPGRMLDEEVDSNNLETLNVYCVRLQVLHIWFFADMTLVQQRWNKSASTPLVGLFQILTNNTSLSKVDRRLWKTLGRTTPLHLQPV